MWNSQQNDHKKQRVSCNKNMKSQVSQLEQSSHNQSALRVQQRRPRGSSGVITLMRLHALLATNNPSVQGRIDRRVARPLCCTLSPLFFPSSSSFSSSTQQPSEQRSRGSVSSSGSHYVRCSTITVLCVRRSLLLALKRTLPPGVTTAAVALAPLAQMQESTYTNTLSCRIGSEGAELSSRCTPTRRTCSGTLVTTFFHPECYPSIC